MPPLNWRLSNNCFNLETARRYVRIKVVPVIQMDFALALRIATKSPFQVKQMFGGRSAA